MAKVDLTLLTAKAGNAAAALSVVNRPPAVSVKRSVVTLKESADLTNGLRVASITVSDDGIGTNVLSLTGADAGLFRIRNGWLELRPGVRLDFERNPRLDVAVVVSDAALASRASASVSIAVTDVNEAASIALEPMLSETTGGTISAALAVARIVVTDDALGSNALRLSGADAKLFSIVGNTLMLRAGTTLDAATDPLLDVTVTVDDANIAGRPDAWASLQIAVRPQEPDTTAGIDHPEKIGIGTWQQTSHALADLTDLGVAWYHDWTATALAGSGGPGFVPMIWGSAAANFTAASLAAIAALPAEDLLVFNEPDRADQSNMTVAQAIALWPKLLGTGKELSSPNVTAGQALGETSWLARFMAEADARDYRVDFVAVHYYATDSDVPAFKAFLEQLYDAYRLPVWITEWALVDLDTWSTGTPGFTADEIADFATDAIRMMDDLDFVERHAWFAAYDGGDGYTLGTHVLEDDGSLTEIGSAFATVSDSLLV
jgi:hypothetical protein